MLGSGERLELQHIVNSAPSLQLDPKAGAMSCLGLSGVFVSAVRIHCAII